LASHDTMDYRSYINIHGIPSHAPSGLRNHVNTPVTEDASIDYVLPIIRDERATPIRKILRPRNIEHLRLPARLNNPLIPYPEEVKQHIMDGSTKQNDLIHGHHQQDLKMINMWRNNIISFNPDLTGPISFDINDLKATSKLRFSRRTDLIHLATAAFAKRATDAELSIMAKTTMNSNCITPAASDQLSFIIAVQRLRMFIAKAKKEDVSKTVEVLETCQDAKFTLLSSATYVYHQKTAEYSYVLIMSPGHFYIYHTDQRLWIAAPSTYFDYIFTMSDILNNLTIIAAQKEYSWTESFINILIKLSDSKYSHNVVVEFMKNLEGLLLNFSDYDIDYPMNWQPLMDMLFEMWNLDKQMIETDYPFTVIINMLTIQNVTIGKYSPLIEVMKLRFNLTRIQLQELSALHKFIYYAECDPDMGVVKFLKRVHTPRVIDTEAIKNMTRLAKKLFFVSYTRRHKTMPNIKGTKEKISYLTIQSNKRKTSTIESLPLAWWDDVDIFNCMDNTSTDDALEFAKDKGALKEEIAFGPGDSRKELLQVIEKPDYGLKQFFQNGPIMPKQPLVKRMRQLRNPIKCAHPARLIPKEREQKLAARLYANGELSDKHALSVIALKMKKILSYFDEQLMTPQDKHRKKLLHIAAQELTKKNMYSLLLDIEGHNQSMQFENTSELAGFCGNLFGETYWNTLPNYFSSLDMYHYDEYVDDVIFSNGQKGGIEGWLNAFWTLHTTLMMKLLRIMTDVEIPTIMVYSDDVNGLLKIDQPSDAHVQSIFNKITSHCFKFGMIVKMSQTNLSKHRVTMLRQHYADGVRADSTLKKLISASGSNNSVLHTESIEVDGICSSVSSAIEMTNHTLTCCYLKNFKIALLLARLPHMILAHPTESGPLSLHGLPSKLVNLLYHIKDDRSYLIGDSLMECRQQVINDVSFYLDRHRNTMNHGLIETALAEIYGQSIEDSKFVDQPDRVLYLQIYDKFVQDMLFFWTYLPASLGGLGGNLQINLTLSGHSSGLSKALHYLKEWIITSSSDKAYFLKYLENALQIDLSEDKNKDESTSVTMYWPSDIGVTPASTSITQAIKSMIKFRARNKNVLKLFDLNDNRQKLNLELVNIFRNNFHPRIVQFYAENTSSHFLDLLVNKIETSSGFLSYVRSLTRLRNSLTQRMLQNIRFSGRAKINVFGTISDDDDIVEYLIQRRLTSYPNIAYIDCDEPLYDDKLEEISLNTGIMSVRRHSPTHYSGGYRVYDTPDMGNEVTYKGEWLDNDRLLGNKEELLAAKLVAVTKWLITKYIRDSGYSKSIDTLDCFIACNVALATLTGQTIMELWNYSPNEIGGEVLHRIPNLKFNSLTYIRSEPNKTLEYTADLNQKYISDSNLVDSNINFDYVRLRLILLMTVRSLNVNTTRLVTRWNFKRLTSIKDVQFVTPKHTDYKSDLKYLNYGQFRGHTFSELRFRYLATHYLNIEDIQELSIMPSLSERSSAEEAIQTLIDELVVNYAHRLDQNYMRVSQNRIEYYSWEPLIEKLEILKPDWKSMDPDSKLIELQYLVLNAMHSSKKITVIGKSEKVKLTIQQKCLDYLSEHAPRDLEFNDLIHSFVSLTKVSSSHSKLPVRIKKYQQKLQNTNQHRAKLTTSLLCEYILYYHFRTLSIEGIQVLDAYQSLTDLLENPLNDKFLTLVHPELAAQIEILGMDYINGFMMTHRKELLRLLEELSENNHLADIILPTNVPNLRPITHLDPEYSLGQEVLLNTYAVDRLPDEAMSSLHDINPLLKYARQCVDIGSSPHIYESPTGSDSMVAQFNLFRTLKNEFGLDRSTKILDLTAGRGDMIFASKQLDLHVKSYSLKDTFTSVYHHPETDFSLVYDIFDTKTIKFITDHDWIHIDVSFTGKETSNILDLIMLLEENNLAYSIRLNSVTLEGYTKEKIEGLPFYEHYLAYPESRSIKTYQVYLVGVPSSNGTAFEGQTLKQTPAYRAIALSYSNLLRVNMSCQRMYEWTPNSTTLYIGELNNLLPLVAETCEKAYYEEQQYYVTRLIQSDDMDKYIYFVKNKLPRKDVKFLESITENAAVETDTVYGIADEEDIGFVSEKSKPYHKQHLKELQHSGTVKCRLAFGELALGSLKYFRSHHPLQDVRSICDLYIKCNYLYPDLVKSGRNAWNLMRTSLYNQCTLKDTRHQKEFQDALKWMVLSAYEGSYDYAILQMRILMGKSVDFSTTIGQTFKMYRMLSGGFDIVQEYVLQGNISLDWINSIRNKLLTREMKKFKYRRSKDETETRSDVIDMQFGDFEIDFDKFIQKILHDTIEIFDPQLDEQTGFVIPNTDQFLSGEFEIGIEQRIQDYLDTHKDLIVNEHGMIIADDDYFEEEFDM
jgi:hypothetical protein